MKPRAAWILATVAGCSRGHPGARPAETRPGVSSLTEQQARDLAIETAAVEVQAIEDFILTSGRVTFAAQKVAHVFSPVSGRVKRVEVDIGQRVKSGAVLAVIESPDVGAASSDVGKARADLVAAERDFDRERELWASRATSERDLDQAQDAYQRAGAELERSKQKLRLLRGGGFDTVTQTYAARAEIQGEVVARNVTLGQDVQGLYGGGSPLELFTVAELDPAWVIADVHEMDSGRVKVGAHATVRVVAYPERAFESSVEWVSGVLDPRTRTIQVRAVLANADHALKPEMYATMQVTVAEKHALAVPRRAVIRVGDQTVVFVRVGAHDGRIEFERRAVEVDEGEGSEWIPVFRGLTRGEIVVTRGAVALSASVVGG